MDTLATSRAGMARLPGGSAPMLLGVDYWTNQRLTVSIATRIGDDARQAKFAPNEVAALRPCRASVHYTLKRDVPGSPIPGSREG